MKKILFLTLILLTSFATARNFDIQSAHINVNILNNGSFIVSETMNVYFTGMFHEGYRDIPTKQEKIKFLEVRVDDETLDERLLRKNPEKSSIEYTFIQPAYNQKKKITLKYMVSNSIKAYDDVCDFYWKIWGSQWNDRIEVFSATINLPEPVENKNVLRRWGHPKLEGTITSDLQTVNYNLKEIPAKQWVEARVVFPVTILSSTKGTQKVEGNGLNKIIAQEEQFAATNTLWSIIKTIYEIMAIASLVLVPLFTITAFAYLYYRYGIEPKVDYQRIYEREPPFEYPPAYVGALFNIKDEEPHPRDFMATILYLGMNGWLKLEKIRTKKTKFLIFKEDKEDYQINLTSKAATPREPSLKKVWNFLREHAQEKNGKLSISLHEIQELDKKNPQHPPAHNFFIRWKETVKNQAKKMEFFGSRKGCKIFSGITAIFLILAVIQLILLIFLDTIGLKFLINILTTQNGIYLILYIIASWEGFFLSLLLPRLFKDALPKRTKKGAQHYERWEAFKRFLKDFSSMKEYPPSHITLWEKYLVYGVSLGVAEEVIKAMKDFFPEKTKNSRIFADGNINHATSISFIHSIKFFNSPTLSNRPKTSGSGTGFGSGFTGGGGFAGGGGGGGFR